MVQINFARKEINCKIVYYGPGLSGKTTNLEQVHAKAPSENKGDLTSISTDGDRTLFFDFMPLDLGSIAGMRTKFHIYTVPGQVYYNSTRKLVLLGADGVIFVADSSPNAMEANKQSLENLKENLAEMGKDIGKMPLVMQWNKRDVEGALDVEVMEKELNIYGAPSFEAVASKGEGVIQTLKAISALVLESINSSEKKGLLSSGGEAGEPASAAQSKPASAAQSKPAPAAQSKPAPAAQKAASTPAPAESAPAAAAGGGGGDAWGGLAVERNEVSLPPGGGAPAAPAAGPEPMRAAAADRRAPAAAEAPAPAQAGVREAPAAEARPVVPPKPMKSPAAPLAAKPAAARAPQRTPAPQARPGTATAVKDRAPAKRAPAPPAKTGAPAAPRPMSAPARGGAEVRRAETPKPVAPVGQVIGGKPRKGRSKRGNTVGIAVTVAVIVLLGGAVAAYLLMLR